jgi:alpha-L-rhamnosidase-like protein
VLADGDAQTDRYLFDGEVTATTWEPRFSYKGFRYVEVEIVGAAQVDAIHAVSVHTDVDHVGTFACSDDTLTWIDDALARTFLNNLHGIPADTPVYEKNGWTADAHLATEAVLHHVDLREAFGKWIQDHADAQDEHGGVPQIVQTPALGRAPDPAWSASMVLSPGTSTGSTATPPSLRRTRPHYLLSRRRWSPWVRGQE